MAVADKNQVKGWGKGKRRKIFFLINALGMAGSEHVVIKLSKVLKKDHDIKIITLSDLTEYDSPPVDRISLTRMKSMAAVFLMIPFLAKRLRRIVDDERPECVISFLEMSNVVNVLATKGSCAKTIISVRAVLSEVYTSGVYGFVFDKLIRKYYPKADLVIPNAKASGEDLVRNYGVPRENIRVSYNPVDIGLITRMAKEKLEPRYERMFKDSRVLITNGRLREQKAHDKLIRIFSEVRKALPGEKLKLVIIGDGSWKSLLGKTVKRLGLEDCVFLIGRHKNPFKFVARSELFVFSSYFEGFPNVLVEAMACRVPVLSTDCPSGPREILAPGTPISKKAKDMELAKYGVLVPVMKRESSDTVNPEERVFIDATVTLLKDKGLLRKYSFKGFERVNAFRSERIALDLLRKI